MFTKFAKTFRLLNIFLLLETTAIFAFSQSPESKQTSLNLEAEVVAGITEMIGDTPFSEPLPIKEKKTMGYLEAFGTIFNTAISSLGLAEDLSTGGASNLPPQSNGNGNGNGYGNGCQNGTGNGLGTGCPVSPVQ